MTEINQMGTFNKLLNQQIKSKMQKIKNVNFRIQIPPNIKQSTKWAIFIKKGPFVYNANPHKI